jgi:hypothetical protein
MGRKWGGCFRLFVNFNLPYFTDALHSEVCMCLIESPVTCGFLINTLAVNSYMHLEDQSQERRGPDNMEGGPSSDPSISAWVDEHSDAELLPSGKVRCTVTQHELPANIELLRAHWAGKK